MPGVVEPVYSPYHGTVEKVLTMKANRVYEWERLFLIKTKNGLVEEVSVGISGHIISVDVKQGENVTPDTVLAKIEDDFTITGCD
ncbi:hypothetical protein WD019_19955 [Fictibacillus sp. Mic-4]|uniref:hypothetical protein n=1 Tax=Fictibacillus sp. Mic-4 TaxID=3132826 RepID=UPI003CECE9DB